MKAIFEMPMPKSCAECPLETETHGTPWCIAMLAGVRIWTMTERTGEFQDTRAPFCPLQIAPDVEGGLVAGYERLLKEVTRLALESLERVKVLAKLEAEVMSWMEEPPVEERAIKKDKPEEPDAQLRRFLDTIL